MNAYAVAVDIGGTFTDLVAYDHDGRQVVYTKSPTTYGNFVEGILDCFAKAKIEPQRRRFRQPRHHAGDQFAASSARARKAALVTTKGFRDVLEIARGNRPDPFDLHYRRDEPLIPRDAALRGRRAHRRRRARSSRRSTSRRSTPLAAKLKRSSIEAVAVFFMNSYANPEHEDEAARDAARAAAGRLRHRLAPR